MQVSHGVQGVCDLGGVSTRLQMSQGGGESMVLKARLLVSHGGGESTIVDARLLISHGVGESVILEAQLQRSHVTKYRRGHSEGFQRRLQSEGGSGKE